jgi:hypothetical protein
MLRPASDTLSGLDPSPSKSAGKNGRSAIGWLTVREAMEYVITSERPFGEIEALTRGALERHGFMVQQTFSLHSATGAADRPQQPGYGVFMLHDPGTLRQPLGLLTLYRRGRQVVIRPMLSSAADVDVDADLVGALVLAGLEL